MKQPEHRPMWRSCRATMVVTNLLGVDLCRKQLEDDSTGPILQAKEADGKPDAETLRRYSRATRQLFQLWDQLMIIDGVLHRNFEQFRGKKDHVQLVVPNNISDTVLEESHAGSLGGHLGEDRTLSRIREKFSCQAMQNRVDNGAELVSDVL